MSRYRVADRASEDLRDILGTIATSSPRAAVRMSDRFSARFAELASSPELGRFVGDLYPEVRRANEGVYAIFYRISGDGVEIARVIHGMRDLPAQFRP